MQVGRWHGSSGRDVECLSFCNTHFFLPVLCARFTSIILHFSATLLESISLLVDEYWRIIIHVEASVYFLFLLELTLHRWKTNILSFCCISAPIMVVVTTCG